MKTQIQEITEKAIELKNLLASKKEIENLLSSKQELIDNSERTVLPDLLDEAGIKSIVTDNIQLQYDTIFRTNVTKATSKSAFDYLYKNQIDGILKKQLIIDITTLDDKVLISLKNNLDKVGCSYNESYEAHYATLSKVLKELYEDGKISSEEFDNFNIYLQPKISIK